MGEVPLGMVVETPVMEKANKKYAVLVGVNEYEKLNNLRFAANDVKLIHDQLLNMGFEPDHIFMLATDADAINMPIKRIIEERIAQVLSSAGTDDMVFIAFAGHGVQIGDTVYFGPQDTQDEIANSAVSINEVM